MALEMEVGVATGDMTYAASYKPLVIPAPPDAKVGTFTRTQLEAQATPFAEAQAAENTATSKFGGA